MSFVVELTIRLIKITILNIYKFISKRVSNRYYAIIQERYTENYCIFALLTAVCVGVNFANPVNVLSIMFHIINLIVISVSVFNIIRFRRFRDTEENMRLYKNASIAIMYFFIMNTLFIKSFVVNTLKIDTYIFFAISLFAVIFLGYCYFILKYCNNWFKLALNAFATPLLAYILYGVSQLIIRDITGKVFVIQNKTVLVLLIVLLSVGLMNFSVFIVPSSRLNDLKVAFYLLVAIFSVISFSSILSYDISIYIVNNFQVPIGLTTDMIDKFIQSSTKAFTLPYLVGTVVGWFFISLRELKESKARTEKHA